MQKLVMSDTDDTDDLLLIPPDFFAIESDSGQSNTDPYYSIVDSLIDQVGNLQNRIKSIESSESFLTNSPQNQNSKKASMQKHIKEFRKYNSSDDLYFTNSTQSTPQKPHSKFRLNSLPTSPYVERFNANKNFLEYKSGTPSPNRNKQSPSSAVAKNDDTLTEVDTFLSKVKTIQRLNAARNLENEFKYGDRNSIEIPRKEEPETHSRNRQNVNMEHNIIKDRTWQSGDTKESVPDYGLGVREQLYCSQLKDQSQYNEVPFSCQMANENSYFSNEFPNLSSIRNQNLRNESLDSESGMSESVSQITTFRNYNKPKLSSDPIHTNAINILNMHRQLTENSAKKSKNSQREQKSKKANLPTINDNLALLSLADIWNTTSSQMLQLNSSQLLQKLQEEKLRRQHCEDLIHELQNRNLELQQKLTVAVKVDESKNSTIGQFQESLQKLMSKVQIFQKEKREWENEKTILKTQHSSEMKESLEKIQYYEKEVSKALNIAHSNHEKASLLEKNCSDLQTENQSLKNAKKDLEDLLYLEKSQKNELLEALNKRELELAEIKEMLNTSKSEIDKTNKTIASYQQDFSKLKEETSRLQEDLRSSSNKIIHYEEERKHIIQEIEESGKRENKLKEDIATLKKQIGQNKLELRNFYQGQMEILVQNKLKEFQTQLDKSESNFKERELAIAKTAASHIQDMSQKYSIEIKLLEKKQQEEIKLYQVQIIQCKRENEDLKTKLNRIQEKRITIAKQLQKIMETQWSEALRIIASGKSPTFNNEESFNTIDQLNSLKTRSYNNLEEILTKHVNEHFNPDSKATLSNDEERHQNDDLKYCMDTPVSSRSHENKQYNENDIQKYINMLLNRPVNEGPSREPEDGLHYEALSWLHERGEGSKATKQSHKDKKLHKPPWK